MASNSRRSCAVSWGDTCSLRRPGTSGLIAGWGPAASDLTGLYEDVRTRLDGLSIVHSPETPTLRSVRHNQFDSKLLGFLGEGSDLLLTISSFVIFVALVHVLMPMFDESVV